MFWKKLSVSVLGAAMLGSSFGASEAAAGDCAPLNCDPVHTVCWCGLAYANIPNNGVPVSATKTDINNAVTSISGTRSVGTPGQVSYEATQLGSSHHNAYISVACNGLATNTLNNRSPAGPQVFQCPVSNPTVTSAAIGVSFRTQECRQNELYCQPNIE